MQFKGLSVLKLRTQLARQLGEENPSNITLCTWTGYDSAWIPLVVDLPSNNEITVILVLNTKSPGENFTVFFSSCYLILLNTVYHCLYANEDSSVLLK